MTGRVLFIMGLHSHQPVGNFDFIFEKANQECYHPFLEMLSRYPRIRMSLHYSGVLLEWIRRNHPETFDLLRRLVETGQVEMMGGGFDEPILVMVPDRDKLGQIRKQSEYLAKYFGVLPEGLWLTERVWEQCLVKAVAESGMSYVAVDDSHFKFAGLTGADLAGYYLTEDQGRMLNVFPMDELLRYYIPFQAPEKTIEYLRTHASDSGAALITYADDGEKFGSWPGTHKHVYLDGWLERFFKLLTENADWIEIVTFAEAQKRLQPKGHVFLPDASYREMMEWVLPVESQHAYEDLVRDLKSQGMWDRAKFFVKGGFWRSFRSKYPEANDMYGKMMLVSEKVAALGDADGRYEAAQDELYQGQCNCAYWHGVFGGLYLPHLRFAVYKHLIAAENIADEELKGGSKRGDPKRNSGTPWCESRVCDYNFDRQDEVLLSSPHLSLYVVPHRGGHLAELDVRAKEFNPLSVLTRRVEAYHRTVLRKQAESQEGGTGDPQKVASIHDSIIFKTEGLERMLFYDPYKREGLIDHVLSAETTLDHFARADFQELGDFVEGAYAFEVSKRRNLQRVSMTRRGTVQIGDAQTLRRSDTESEEKTEQSKDLASQRISVSASSCFVPLVIRKDITLGPTQPVFAVEYELTMPDGDPNVWPTGGNGGLPTSRDPLKFIFGVEMCYAMLAAHASDRYYYLNARDGKLGELGMRLDQPDVTRFGIVDEWQSLDIGLMYSLPAHVWSFPLETVSQSEAGFEAVYQGSVLLSRWAVELEPGKTWKLRMEENHQDLSH